MTAVGWKRTRHCTCRILTFKVTSFQICLLSIRKMWNRSISFSFLLFSSGFFFFFTTLCVRTSGRACLSSFWNFLILKIWFYLPSKKWWYCNFSGSFHILLLLKYPFSHFSSLCFFAFLPQFCFSVLPLFLQFHTPELVYAFLSLCLSVCLIPPCTLFFLLCALMQFTFT